MSRTAAVPVIARLQADTPGAVRALMWRGAGAVAIVMTLSLVLLAQGPGDLDPTFGVGGTVTTDFGAFEQASALVLQPDGKLVAAGGSGSRYSDDFALARYLPDGSLDPTFGVGGKATADFGGHDFANDLVLQPDGKLVAAGFHFSLPGQFFDFALARFLPDGSLDPTFGVGGEVTTHFEGAAVAEAMVLQPDGKLVAAGNVTSNTYAFALARYLPNGSLDPTFGVGGKVTTDGGVAEALVLQPDGKLVAAGGSATGVDIADFALARYLPDGSLDAGFGIGGKITTDFGLQAERAYALVLQPDGKLVAAGSGTHGPAVAFDFALARYLPDGSLDATFGTDGTVVTDLGGVDDNVYALVLQPDGKLVAAGIAGPHPVQDFALARYLPDGSLDATFGTAGTVTTDFGVFEVALALVLQPDGKLVAAGGSAVDFALARYGSPPVVDTIAPTITISASLTTLWPPNGRLVSVLVSGTMTDEPGGSGLNPSSGEYVVIDEVRPHPAARQPHARRGRQVRGERGARGLASGQ